MRSEIVLFTPGLGERAVWGEHVVARGWQRALQRELPGARVRILGWADRTAIARSRVDLLVSTFTGDGPPWRADDIGRDVEGISILCVLNHAGALEEFARLPFDGFVTNGARAVEVLGRQRPAAWLPLAADDDQPRARPGYRADVVFLGSGGHGHRPPETPIRFLTPAKGFDFHLWGSFWDRAYWAWVDARHDRATEWHRWWRGPLPFDRIGSLYRSAGIVLGYHEDSQRAWGMWNNRIFEALAAGAFLICDAPEGLADAFGDAVVATSGGDETVDLIRHYLRRPAERARRAELGRRIVSDRFTYRHWALRLLAFAEMLREMRGLPPLATSPRGPSFVRR